MPLNTPTRPSLALGLLKAIGVRAGYPVEILPLKFHFALRFADLPTYAAAASGFQHGLGEWVFSEAAFGRFSPRGGREPTFQAFLRSRGVPESTVESLHGLRAAVPAFLEHCRAVVDWGEYDLVGFTSTCTELNPLLALAQRIREWSPSTLTMIGGAKCDGEMGGAIFSEFSQFDFVFSGEAEHSFPALLEDLARGGKSPVAGVYRRDLDSPEAFVEPPPTEMSSLPTPDYSDYLSSLRELGAQDRIPFELTIEGSRGCWWGEKSLCTFCGLNGATVAYRRKDPQRLVEEVSELVEKHGVFKFVLTDNILDLGYFDGFFDRLSELDFTLDVFVEIKSNIKRHELETLKKGGVRTLLAGIDNVDSHILDLMHKGVSGLQNVQLLRWCTELNLDLEWTVLLNFPGETDEDYENVLRILRSITHLQPPVHACRIQLHRFSPYFREVSVGSDDWGDSHSGRYPGDELKLYRGTAAGGIRITGPAEHYRHTFDLDEAALRKLAYDFEYTVERTQPDPRLYERIVDFVHEWQLRYTPQALVYYKAPSCLRIEDRRFGLSARTITLGEREKEIYLGASEITTPERLARKVEAKRSCRDISVSEVRGFLDELVEERLALREGNRYLALAVRWDPVRSNLQYLETKRTLLTRDTARARTGAAARSSMSKQAPALRS